MSNYDLANERITEDIATNNVDNANANTYAKNIMKSYEQDKQTNHTRHELQEQMQTSQTSQPSQPSQQQQSPPAQQYQPPVPPQTQYPVPQQSQHMNVNQMYPSSHEGGSSYTGFDTSDNLSPLDTAFNTMKLPMRLPATHNAPRVNDNVAPNDASNIDKFSLF
jgi:hypothetical protein